MRYGGLSELQIQKIEAAIQQIPFVSLVGVRLDDAEPGVARMSLEVRRELMRNNGVMHGGAIATLVDTTAAFAVIPLLADTEMSVTVDLTLSYIRPVTRGRAHASARVLREGSRLIFLTVEVLDDDGNVVATALTTYSKLRKR